MNASLIDILNNPKAQILLLILALWNLVWKGFALWEAARNDQRRWFIFILALNTFGILEIIYLFYFTNRRLPKPTSDDHVP